MRIRDLPEIDIESPALTSNPAEADAAVAAIRDECGIARSQRGVEALSYDAVAELHRHEDLAESIEGRLATVGCTEGRLFDLLTRTLINQQGPTHLRLRKAVAPWFSKSGAERYREETRLWVDAQLTELEDGRCEFAEVMGTYLPAVSFCHTIGSPISDAGIVASFSQGVVRRVNSFTGPEIIPLVEEAAAGAWDYLHAAVQEKRRNPGPDLISAMLEAEGRGELNEDEIMDLLFTMLLASTESTGGQTSLNMVTLAAHPDQWRALKDDPELIPNAVVELNRWCPTQMSAGSFRMPTKPVVDFRGVEVTPDVILWGNVFSANRDPKVYPDPGRLDVTRRMRMQPLGFGVGRHSCLGRMLSLMDQQEALRGCLNHWAEIEILEAKITGSPYMQSPERVLVGFTPEYAVA